MTKLEYLRAIKGTGTSSAGNVEIIYTWKTLGGNSISKSTKIYNKDQIYLIEVEDSQINNYLIYCNKEFIASKDTNFKWANAILYDYSFGEISFGNDIITPYFTILLTKDEFDLAGGKSLYPSANWLPYKGINDNGQVIISEDDYQRCISCLGYPFITEDELEYSRDEITNLAIRPALEEYFHWLPAIIVTTSGSGSSSSNALEVDMPSEAYAVIGVSLQQSGTSGSSLCMSPMSYAMEQSLYGGYTGGYFYGKRGISASGMRNGNAIVASLQNRALSQALINYNRRVHYEGPYTRADSSRYIKVYSNTNGTFNIWWAKRTLDFNDVEYANRTRVFEYAQACIKELFANLRRQSKSDIPGLIDYNSWLSESQEVKDRITKEYKSMVKASGILRGSN